MASSAWKPSGLTPVIPAGIIPWKMCGYLDDFLDFLSAMWLNRILGVRGKCALFAFVLAPLAAMPAFDSQGI